MIIQRVGHRKHRQAGFTIPELLVALIVTAILSTVVVNYMIDNLRSSSIETSRQNLLGDAYSGLDRVGTDVQLSSEADGTNRWDDSHAPGAPTNLQSWASDASTVVLAISAVDTSGKVIFDDPLNYVTAKDNHVYFVSYRTLYRRIIAAPVNGNAAKTTCPQANSSPSCPADAVVMRNVSAFSVKYIDASNVEVDPSEARAVELTIQLSNNTYGTNISASYKTRMVFRNG